MAQPSLILSTGQRCTRRRGLAPLELVLWLLVLLFVLALIINYGTMATWRVRGEIVAQDAAFRARSGRTGASEGRLLEQWPLAARMEVEPDAPVTQLDDPFLDHAVTRGPLPNGFIVRPILDPDATGAYRGLAAVERGFPLLPRLGPYRSGEILNSLVDRKWTNWEMGIPNLFRRILVLYQLPRTDPNLPDAFRRAVYAVLGIPHFADLRVLDRDTDLRLITGRWIDFHPRVHSMCELDRDVVRADQVERLIDTRDPLRRVQLGAVSRLPRTMTDTFLREYRQYVRDLENRIDSLQQELSGLPPPSAGRAAQIRREIASLQAEVDRIRPKIDQLEQYHDRLDSIEDQLRQRADLVIP